MNIAQARLIPLQDYLASRGFEGRADGRGQIWYLSPLRTETNPSFKVNPIRNVWYDFGLGKGGDIIDLEMALSGVLSVAEALERIDGFDGAYTLAEATNTPPPSVESDAKITKVTNVTSYGLLEYMRSRGIDTSLLPTALKQVHYTRGPREFFGLGIENESGGFEVRSKFFKGSLVAKDITHIPGKGSDVLMFEGLFDYLTFATLHSIPVEPTIILNSVSMKDRALQAIASHGYTGVRLFRDNDDAGKELLSYLQLNAHHTKVVDEAKTYEGFNDFNAWHMAGIEQQRVLA